MLNIKNKMNYHIVYQTSIVDQKQQSRNTYRNDTNNRRGGYRGCNHYNNNSERRAPTRCFVCYNVDHLCSGCPFKDQTDLKFCTKCGVGDHSLENFPIMLEMWSG